MTISGQPTEKAREALLAAALLRIGNDTKGSRLFKDLVWPGVQSWADAERAPALLAERLGWLPQSARSAVEEAFAGAVRARQRAESLGARLVTFADEGYPEGLRHLPDPPIALWVSGQEGCLDQAAVAVVGSRNASPIGLETARRLAQGLAAAGLVVTSGLARGVDGAAHRGALQGGGLTVAVLGCGLDVAYPRQHRQLAVDVRAQGCLVSELPPGTPPLPKHFPLRNRIISGLSRAVVVVEASEHSGSLITARMALEQGRDVLAVPGNVVSGCHRGCHALIKDGARLVETVEDILEEIRWVPAPGSASKAPNHSQDNKLLASVRAGEVFTVEDLSERNGRPASEIFAELGRLELEGLIARNGLGTFIRLS
ncbi:MAG: DNA-processing protein DprA [Acidobacteriota bacterium]